jgi:hypothetical protein
VVYFRNKDLTGQSSEIFQLVKPALPDVKTYPVSSDIDVTALTSEKNIVYKSDINDVEVCKLKTTYNTDFVGFTTEHPLYDSIDKTLMLPEFDRITTYTDNLKALQYQTEALPDSKYIGFTDTDFFALGQTTCGAYLYPVIANTSKFQVVGNTTTATLIIPANSELLIPFIYEYRMVDRLGNINGQLDTDPNTILEYNKKLGIDILVNNEIFRFDIMVNSRLKSKVVTFDQMTVQSISNKFKNEQKENLY